MDQTFASCTTGPSGRVFPSGHLMSSAEPSRQAGDRRIDALDGLRGALTLMVLLSHGLAETEGGIRLGFGWIAVDVFFVLSGFLVGRLILEKGHHPNFHGVFYARRILRTFPLYFLCLGAISIFSQASGSVPLASHFTFTQTVFMGLNETIGSDWLGPTWTLAVEEQFYLVAPLLLLFPRRKLPLLLLVVAGAASLGRYALAERGHVIAGLTFLPTRADAVAIGLAAAFAIKATDRDFTTLLTRAMPVVALAAIALVGAFAGSASPIFVALSHLFASIGGACLILSLSQGAPEASRLSYKPLIAIGRLSYSVYLVHLPILWGAHALLFRHAPSIASAKGLLVSLACLAVCLPLAQGLTRLIEQPATVFGRGLAWGDVSAGEQVALRMAIGKSQLAAKLRWRATQVTNLPAHNP